LSGEPSVSEIEARYRESLVRVRFTQRVAVSTAEPPQEQELLTAGVVVSPDGLVLTSAMVYEPFNQVPHGAGIRFPAALGRTEAEIAKARIVFPDGSEYPAEHVGRDPDADVGFFRILAGEDPEGKRGFRPVVFGSPDPPALGQSVLVVSVLPEPLGPGLSVERSEVQALVTNPSEGYLVTTVAADPVGALVVDLAGNPLGMLDALTVPPPEAPSRNPLALASLLRGLSRGIGRAFARPAAHFADAVAEPPRGTTARRGWLGVMMQPLSGELAEHLKLPVRSGILLAYVYRQSPAEQAGLKTGDLLVELEGKPIAVSDDGELSAFQERVLRSGSGAPLHLGVLRGGERLAITATLGPAPRSVAEAQTYKSDELDVTVREVTFDYLAAQNREPDTKGVVIDKAPVPVRTHPRRLARGDLLVRVGQRPVENVDGFKVIVEELRQSRPNEIVLFVERGQESFFFALKPEWE
jgi:S1-C subfamily serine protease